MMKISFSVFYLVTVGCLSGRALASEDMKEMPSIKPKRVFTIQSRDEGETQRKNRGFGDREPEVQMMNLMMVEGSGFEGMDMSKMKMADAKPPSSHSHEPSTVAARVEFKKSPSPAKVGPNVFEFVIKDPKSGKPLIGLKPASQVFMTSMDMGTTSPEVKEIKPGYYQVTALFSMQGPWALKIRSSAGEKILSIHVSK